MFESSTFITMNILKQYIRTTNQPARSLRKGRSRDLLYRRDQKLAVRFYFHISICSKSYNETLALLHDEFDLSEKVIITRLRTNQNTLDELFAIAPKAADLRKRYSYFRF